MGRQERFLGVTVLPEYIQSEGIDGVLDNLVEKVGANAVATSPYLMEEADRETGNREPPAGAGSVRLLDRPLFGKREVWVRTAPSEALPWAEPWARVSGAPAASVAALTRHLSWREAAHHFDLNWKSVAAIVPRAVAYGLARRRRKPLHWIFMSRTPGPGQAASLAVVMRCFSRRPSW